MSFLFVMVRRAALVGPPTQFNTYVTLKLQSVRSTTVSVKGNNPSWEQDFLFETNRMDIGLIIEVWNKGIFWDKLLGTQWMPLTRIKYTKEVEEGQWLSLDSELMIEEGEVVGTKVPTGHSLLLEAHFEIACDLQDLEEEELTRKLQELNLSMDQEITCLREQDRRHNFSLNSGVSEDSDYTSDVSYPTGQHPSASVHHHNSSISQYGGAAELTRRATEYNTHNGNKNRYIDQGNSYETEYDDGTNYRDVDYVDRSSASEDPLYYNSRPNNRMNSHSTERSRSTRSTSGYDNSLDYESDVRFSFETDRSGGGGRHCHWEEEAEETIDPEVDKRNLERFPSGRRRSLERQTGFDESLHDRFLERFNQATTTTTTTNTSTTSYQQDSTEAYPQSSFDSYQSFREEPTGAASHDWDKSDRYSNSTMSTGQTVTDPYYVDRWSEETEAQKTPKNDKYPPEDTRNDWGKVNGTVAPRKKPEAKEWRDDSTGSDWQKESLETDWSKDSSRNEWAQEVLPAKDLPAPAKRWGEDVPTSTPTVVVPPVVVQPKTNGWSRKDMPKPEVSWSDEVRPSMSNQQMDSLISEWQDSTDQQDWMPDVEEEDEEEMEEEEEEEMEEEEEEMAEDSFDRDLRGPPSPPVKLEFSPKPESPVSFKPPVILPPPEVMDFENSLGVGGKIEADVRRASVLSTKNTSEVLMLGEVGLPPKSGLPITGLPIMGLPIQVPELVVAEQDPTMSRAKRRWITAFNKIVAQLNEVGGSLLLKE